MTWTRKAAGTFRSMVLAGAAAAACGLSACVQYASSDPALPPDPQALHPIVVASAPMTLDIYPVGGALDARSLADIRAFARKYRRFGSGEVLVLTAGSHGSATRAAEEVRQALAAAGIRGPIAITAQEPLGGGELPPIRVAFLGLKAEVTTPCGQWPEDLASGSSLEGWKNEPWENFGCATQATLAAQVDDPRDFVQARPPGPSDVAMRMRAIEAVRNGQDPGTNWKTDLVPIGGSASSSPQSSPLEFPPNERLHSGSRGCARAPDRARAACVDPGVLRIAGRRRAHCGRDRRPAHGQGSRQTQHGRRGRRGRSLSQCADAECDRARGACEQGRAALSARRACELLRRRHEAHHHRPDERHHALSQADRERGQRISRDAVRGRRFHSCRFDALPDAGREAARTDCRRCRRERRGRRFDRRPQSRLASLDADRDGDDHRRLRSRLRNRGARLQSGSAAGRRGGGVCARTRRCGVPRPAPVEVRREFEPARGPRDARPHARSARKLVRFPDRRHARFDAVDRARHASCLDGVGAPRAGRRGRRDDRRRARSRQSAQREEHRRQSARRAAARQAAEARAQRRRHAEAAGNPDRRNSQGPWTSRRSRSSRTTPGCSARRPTTGR